MIRYSQPHVLSHDGSNRATAYIMNNKSLTRGGLTHAVWTDAIATTCGRTFDHAAGHWGDTWILGEGADNHNAPTLTTDAGGYLHLAYGPHGASMYSPVREWAWPAGKFKYSVSSMPGSFEGLKTPHVYPPGYAATYPSMACTSTGRVALVSRAGEYPPSLMFQHSRPDGGWSDARALMCQRIKPCYTYYGGHIVCGPDDSLYVSGHFYSEPKTTPSGSHGIAILKSTDMGDTWTDLRGEKALLPIEYEARWSVPHADRRHNPYIGGIEVDSKGQLWALTFCHLPMGRSLLLSRWEDDRWHTVDVAVHLPEDRSPVGSCAAAFTLDHQGRIHLAVQAILISDESRKMDPVFDWGHPSSEIFHLMSHDEGRTFSCHQISPGNPDVCSALPNLSKSGLFHPVKDPLILYTHGNIRGLPGEGCRATVKTQVHGVFAETDPINPRP